MAKTMLLASWSFLAPCALLVAPPWSQAPAPAVPVVVAAVVEQEIVPTVSLLGAVEPRRRSVVSASIEGAVVAYFAREGSRVAEGDVLAQLRDDTLREDLRAAEAALEEARENQRHAAADLERSRQLSSSDAVTAKALDAAVNRERTLSLKVPQAEAQVEALKINIEKKKVRSPFAGQVVTEHCEVGEVLPLGGRVATVVDIGSVFVRASVPERYVRFLADALEVAVHAEAARGKAYTGRIASIPDLGDPVSRSFPVRVEVPNDGRLRAAMSARVELPAGEPRRALVVPKDAILLRGTQSFVFVAAADGTAEQRPVTTGAASGPALEVLSGLRAGEEVVVRGN